MAGKPGGKQPGAGRPKGALSRITDKARHEAMASGMLPHEWLLKVSRGEGIPHKSWKIKYGKDGIESGRELVEEDVYADFPTRIDAAKAAAPFYAPKLANQIVSATATVKVTKEDLPTLNNEDLERIVAEAAVSAVSAAEQDDIDD